MPGIRFAIILYIHRHFLTVLGICGSTGKLLSEIHGSDSVYRSVIQSYE